MADAKPISPELKFLKLEVPASGAVVEIACRGVDRLVVQLSGEGDDPVAEQEIALHEGRGRLSLPMTQPFCRVLSLTAFGPGGTRQYTAADYLQARWRWLFAPIPLQVDDISHDVRNYGTRIPHRQMLYDYAMRLAHALLTQPEPDGIAIAQVTAVLCYRLCDAPRLATPEALDRVWALLDAFRAQEGIVNHVHWSLSIRYACAQLGLRYGDQERCLLALSEMQPLLAATREKPAAIYNFVKGCLLLGALRLLREEWAAARSALDQAVEIAYFAPTHATRSFGAARELSDVLMTCAHCIAGRETAAAKLTGRGTPSRYWDPAIAIRSTLRFKNDVFLDQTVQRALREYPPPAPADPDQEGKAIP